MVKTRIWALLLGGIFLACVAAYFVLDGMQPAGQVANIYQNGVCIASFDLSKIVEGETYVVQDSHGCNIIEVEPGRIRMKEADCPDQICVRAGWSGEGAKPIVCLPHRLVIQIEAEANMQGTDALDAISN